jgi:uncharacterized membrane protein
MQMPPSVQIIQTALVILGSLMLAGAFIWMVLEPEHSVWGLFYLNLAVIDFYLASRTVKH